MAFYLGIVKYRFCKTEFNRISKRRNPLDYLFHLALLRGRKIFGVCTRIGYVALLVKLLEHLKALFHRHFVFFAEHTLKL